MDLTVMIDEAIELEERFGACYDQLSKTAEDGLAPEMKQFAREEKSHENVLKTGRNFVSGAPDLVGQQAISNLEIRCGLRAAENLQAELLSGKADFRQGLKRLHDLERRFERIHMTTAAEIKDFSLKKLFESLARADAEHRQRLERLIARL